MQRIPKLREVMAKTVNWANPVGTTGMALCSPSESSSVYTVDARTCDNDGLQLYLKGSVVVSTAATAALAGGISNLVRRVTVQNGSKLVIDVAGKDLQELMPYNKRAIVRADPAAAVATYAVESNIYIPFAQNNLGDSTRRDFSIPALINQDLTVTVYWANLGAAFNVGAGAGTASLVAKVIQEAAEVVPLQQNGQLVRFLPPYRAQILTMADIVHTSNSDKLSQRLKIPMQNVHALVISVLGNDLPDISPLASIGVEWNGKFLIEKGTATETVQDYNRSLFASHNVPQGGVTVAMSGNTFVVDLCEGDIEQGLSMLSDITIHYGIALGTLTKAALRIVAVGRDLIPEHDIVNRRILGV